MHSEDNKEVKVYAAICSVMELISKKGIAKTRDNTQGGGTWKFRGIDDVYNVLAPFLSQCKLLILPRVLNRHQTERQSKSGGALFYTVVEVEFDFISAEDGSKHTIKIFGEAMDSSDKSTNKAMSAAYKYACIEAFCIPTEGDNDADGSSPDPDSKPKKEANNNKPKVPPKAEEKPKSGRFKLGSAANKKNWSKENLADYAKARWGITDAKTLTEDQITAFISTIESASFTEAMKTLEFMRSDVK